MQEGLHWTSDPPSSHGYYWVRCPGWDRGVVVWVFVGTDGRLIVDRPLMCYLADVVDGLWAGPIPEPPP